VEDSCEHANETSFSIKDKAFFDQLSNMRTCQRKGSDLVSKTPHREKG
jgi:hypothetical protein